MNTIVADLSRMDSTGSGIKKSRESDEKKGSRFDEILNERRDQNVPGETGKEQEDSHKETRQDIPGSELLSSMLLAEMPQMAAEPAAVQVAGSEVLCTPVLEAETAKRPVSGQVDTPVVTGNGQAKAVKETAGESIVPVMKNTVDERSMTEQTPRLINPVVHEKENFQNTDVMTETSNVQHAVEKVSDTADKEQRHADAPVTSMHSLENGQRAAEQTKVSDKAPAKNGDVQTENIHTEYMDQLKTDIIKQVASGKQQFEIQLNPANLGKMIIKASYEAGKAVISIVCSESKTMQAMSQQARELGAMMEARTGTQTEVIVDRPSEDYLQQQAEQEGRGQGNESRRQQNENKKTKYHDSLDFLQQLRLGLA